MLCRGLDRTLFWLLMTVAALASVAAANAGHDVSDGSVSRDQLDLNLGWTDTGNHSDHVVFLENDIYSEPRRYQLVVPEIEYSHDTRTGAGLEFLMDLHYISLEPRAQTATSSPGMSVNTGSVSTPASATTSSTALPIVTPLTNNVPLRYLIQTGEKRYYVLNLSSTDFTSNNNSSFADADAAAGQDDFDNNSNRDSDSTEQVFITANTCQLPTSGNGDVLTMKYASSLEDLVNNNNVQSNDLIKGFGNITIDISMANLPVAVYVEISTNSENSAATTTTTPTAIDNNEQWTFELGISTYFPLHRYTLNPNLYLIDTDFQHALLITANLTNPETLLPGFNETDNYESLDNNTRIYDIYIYPLDNDVSQLSHSYCAVLTQGALLNTNNADVTVTRRGLGNLPKQQFFVSGLNHSTGYHAILTLPNSQPSTSNTGGTIYSAMNFTTQSEPICQLIFNLDFCTEVAYAVPGNASVFSSQELTKIYDNMAEAAFANFTKSQQFISCDARNDSRYSGLKTCDDCSDAYRQWLCTTMIPRCQDWSNQSPFLSPRVPGSSRNPLIDSIISPGPYREILPCADLCYGIMQSCDSQFGFQCPEDGTAGFLRSYGYRSDDGDITCNYLGAVYFLSAATTLSAPMLTPAVITTAVMVLIMFL